MHFRLKKKIMIYTQKGIESTKSLHKTYELDKMFSSLIEEMSQVLY